MGERASAEGAAKEFREFLRRDWESWLSESPETATAVGLRDHDDRWTDDSPQGIARRRRHLEQTAEELGRFSPGSLGGADRLNLRLYRDLVESARQGLEYGNDPFPFRFGFPRNLWMPLSQVDGIHLSAPDVLMMQPRTTTSDYRVLLRRLGRLPTAVDQTLALLKGGLARGWAPARVALRTLPEQIAGLVPSDSAKSALLQPFAEFTTAVPEDERTELLAEAHRLYERELAPTLRRLRGFLEETYLPQCRETVGASTLPQGGEWYRFLVRWETTTELTPEALHEIGLNEIRRIRVEMEKVRDATGFEGTLREFAEKLRTDPQFAHPSADALVDGYRSLAKRIDPELARQFGRLPRLPYGILPVPEYRAPASPTAYYISGAAKTGRPGYFYANTFDLPARPSWEMESLTLHEAVPGHHLQLALMEELEDLPEFRRFSGYTAFIEGWGLYAEGLGADLGLYRDPYARYGSLVMDAWRSARLVVDTGMHALGWSRDKAIEFLRDTVAMSETDIIAEIDRYISWPAQALAYKTGQLKLRELRHRAEERLGPGFDVRAFHDFVLAEGGLPLGILSELFDEWLASRPPPAG